MIFPSNYLRCMYGSAKHLGITTIVVDTGKSSLDHKIVIIGQRFWEGLEFIMEIY